MSEENRVCLGSHDFFQNIACDVAAPFPSQVTTAPFVCSIRAHETFGRHCK